jgi:hypothetical protein
VGGRVGAVGLKIVAAAKARIEYGISARKAKDALIHQLICFLDEEQRSGHVVSGQHAAPMVIFRHPFNAPFPHSFDKTRNTAIHTPATTRRSSTAGQRGSREDFIQVSIRSLQVPISSNRTV